jgi:pimeloyl-ACP methyl ester carboxylesterase
MVLLTLAALSGSFVHAQVFAPPGKMVDVKGHHLHLNCFGKGRPTVVLEGGAAAGFSFDWALVQPEVATTTRVCSYDRAGYAWSDPGPEPRTLSQIAYELRTVLHAAHERSPFVLVGHSFGALIVRQFAQLYPEETAGFIFVDGTHESSPLLLNNKVVHMRELSRKRAVPEIQKSVQNSRAAKAMRAAPKTRLDPPYDQLPQQAQEFRKAALQGDFQHTSGSEFEFLPEEMNDLWVRRQKEPIPFEDKPLIVISAAARTGSPPPGVSEEDWRQLNEEKGAQQADLARLSQNSKAFVAKESDHEIHIHEPRLVVDAIRDVVDAVHSRRSLR